MTRPFTYVKVSPLKYLVCKYFPDDVMYQYGSIECTGRIWVFFANTDDTEFLTGNEMIRIGRKVISLNSINKAKPNA